MGGRLTRGEPEDAAGALDEGKVGKYNEGGRGINATRHQSKNTNFPKVVLKKKGVDVNPGEHGKSSGRERRKKK